MYSTYVSSYYVVTCRVRIKTKYVKSKPGIMWHGINVSLTIGEFIHYERI